MKNPSSLRRFTLLQKELQEYKLSLFWTPIVIAAVLTVLMLVSVLVANRITAMSDVFLDVVMSEHTDVSPTIVINLDGDEEIEITTEGSLGVPAPPAPPTVEYEVEVASPEEMPAEEDWNFSREWRFEPQQREKPEYESAEVGSLNPVLHVIHGFLLVVLVLVTANYLLGCLYNDRKDRSILFWKSMPVSEWQEVITRLTVALVVAPAIYIAVSLVLQVVFVLLAMLLLWRMDMDPFAMVLANVHFDDLLLQQVGGWLMTALWVAPVYGWLMLASAFARRSPFLAAITPVVALMLLEVILFGSNHVIEAVINHVPHYIGGESVVGFYFSGAYWQQIDFVSLISGLVFAAITVVASVYLRRYRFDL
jgi:ABC-2 type transport system permease protein